MKKLIVLAALILALVALMIASIPIAIRSAKGPRDR